MIEEKTMGITTTLKKTYPRKPPHPPHVMPWTLHQSLRVWGSNLTRNQPLCNTFLSMENCCVGDSVP